MRRRAGGHRLVPVTEIHLPVALEWRGQLACLCKARTAVYIPRNEHSATRTNGKQTICAEWENHMKHAYVPRTTSYTLSPEDELNDLRMSEQVRPLYDHVRQFIRETVDPMAAEFYRHGEKKTDRWSFTPGQIEDLAKAKARAKEVDLWNVCLPNAAARAGRSK